MINMKHIPLHKTKRKKKKRGRYPKGRSKKGEEWKDVDAGK